MSGSGSNPNSRANLKKGVSIGVDAKANQLKGAEKRRRRGLLRNAALETLEQGHITVKATEVELIGVDGKKVECEFVEARLKVPNYLAIISTVIKEAAKGNMKAVEILNEFDQNYKNREIKAKEKSNKVGQGILEHINNMNIKIGKTEKLDIPVTPYEELNRSID